MRNLLYICSKFQRKHKKKNEGNKHELYCGVEQRKHKKKNEGDQHELYCGVEHTHVCDVDNCTCTYADPKLHNEHK